MKQLNWNENFVLNVVYHKDTAPQIKEALTDHCLYEGIDWTCKPMDQAPKMICFSIETCYREAAKLLTILNT